MKLGHFNNVTDIITSIVRLCVASTPPQVLDRMGEVLSATFSEDILLTVSLHGVKKISEFVNGKRSYVWPGLIATLLSLNIRVSCFSFCFDAFDVRHNCLGVEYFSSSVAGDEGEGVESTEEGARQPFFEEQAEGG